MHDFLPVLAKRLGLLKSQGRLDTRRAGEWFVKWWRDKGKEVYPDTPYPSAVEEDATSTRSGVAETGAEVGLGGDDSAGLRRVGWGFDLEWDYDPMAVLASAPTTLLSSAPPSPHTMPPDPASNSAPVNTPVINGRGRHGSSPQPTTSQKRPLREDQIVYVQRKMEECIDAYMVAEAEEDTTESVTQEKKRVKEDEMKKRKARSLRRLASKKGG